MTRKHNTIQVPAPNAPRKLWEVYKEKFHGNCSRTAEYLGVNSAYVWNLLKKGVEPTDKTPQGQYIRKKLFLPRHKQGNVPPPKEEVPEYIRQWRSLPTEERERVIQQYITWRNKNNEE